MGGKNIFYHSYAFYPDPDDPSQLIRRPQTTKEKPVQYPDDCYNCNYLVYKNYSAINHMTFNLGIDKAPPDFQIENKSMNINVFNCVIAGKGTFNGHPFERGVCYYTKAGQGRRMYADHDDPWISVWFAVDGLLGKKLVDRLDERYSDQMFSFANPDELLRFAEFMLYDFTSIRQSEKYVKGAVELLMSFLDPDIEVEAEPDASIPLHHQKIVRQSIALIERNIANVTVASLAEEAHLETKYYSKIFASIMGVSPKQYLMRIKMELATHYLSATAYTVEEITALLGYKHRNSLNDAFQVTFGISPSEYRKKWSDGQ